MMDPNTYWDWFWTDAYYRLIIGGPITVLLIIGYGVWLWLESREEDTDRPDHFISLGDINKPVIPSKSRGK